MSSNTTPLTDKELIQKVYQWVHKLAETGGDAWTLRVPVDFNNDPDMLIIEVCKRLEKYSLSPVESVLSEQQATDARYQCPKCKRYMSSDEIKVAFHDCTPVPTPEVLAALTAHQKQDGCVCYTGFTNTCPYHGPNVQVDDMPKTVQNALTQEVHDNEMLRAQIKEIIESRKEDIEKAIEWAYAVCGYDRWTSDAQTDADNRKEEYLKQY